MGVGPGARAPWADGDDERAGGPPADRTYRVAEIVQGAGRVLEQRFGTLWVEGEVGDAKLAQAGHLYFTLQEPGAALAITMWRSDVARLKFRIERGQQLRVRGRLGMYVPAGKFQLYADRAEPAGLGARMLALEQLQQRLQAEGLFAPERKRPLPAWPHTIGVVTSAHGAAIHDIIRVAQHRCPSRILLAPAQVQGAGAAASLIAALQQLWEQPDVEVIILGRGGGSTDDLWAFHDEALVRTIAASPVPVVTGIGHETDRALADLAADVSAATPSQAAALVVPDLAALEQTLDERRSRLESAMKRRVLDAQRRHEAQAGRLRAALRGRPEQLARRRAALHLRLAHAGAQLGRDARAQLVGLRARLDALDPRRALARDRRALAAATAALEALGAALTRDARVRLARAGASLHALSPLRVLERGYAVVQREDGRVLVDVTGVEAGQAVAIRLRRGTMRARVTGVDASDPEPTR